MKFSLTAPESSWTLDGVIYKSRSCRVQLLDGLLDDGRERTQDEGADYSLRAIKENRHFVPSYPLLNAVITTAFRNRNGKFKEEIEKLRTKICNLAEENWLVTSTRIIYNPSGLDEVVHDYKTPAQTSIKVPFVGPNRVIIASDKKVCKALLGTEDIEEINKVYQWLTGNPAYITRLNERPTEKIETVAGFSADSYGALLRCGRNPTDASASLGVNVVAQKTLKMRGILRHKKSKIYCDLGGKHGKKF